MYIADLSHLDKEPFFEMAGNFWQSSHAAQWILDPVALLRSRNDDLQALTEEEYQKIIIFFANFMQVKLGVCLVEHLGGI